MGLSISTTNAQLELERTAAKLGIESQSASLSLRAKQAEVSINTEKPMVIIDQYECFATAGLKNNYDLTKSASEEAYQQVLEYIGKTAVDGDALAAIENGGNPIKSIAVRDAYPEHVFGLDFIPKAGPKIEFTGNIDIEWERNWEGVHNGVEGDFNPGYININFEPAIIRSYLKQYPSIDIEYLGNNIDSRI
jgi:hypothetical protein